MPSLEVEALTGRFLTFEIAGGNPSTISPFAPFVPELSISKTEELPSCPDIGMCMF
jgi:hypothetical protein